jgi:hypothetical protein
MARTHIPMETSFNGHTTQTADMEREVWTEDYDKGKRHGIFLHVGSAGIWIE